MALPRQLARTLWPAEAPIDEGRVKPSDYGVPMPEHEALETRIATPLGHIASILDAIRDSLADKGGRPISLINGAVANAAGNADVIYDGPRPGNIWRVELVYVSAAAAAAAAIVEAYVDGIDEATVAGFLPNLNGNSPSRGFLALAQPAVVFGGSPFIIRVSGLPVGASVTARIQGENQTIGED